MSPEAVAAIFTAVVIAVIACALLARQASRHDIVRMALLYRIGALSRQNLSLQRSLWRAQAGQQRAEELTRRLCGDWIDPEAADLLGEEDAAFEDIANLLRADMGISDEGGAS